MTNRIYLTLFLAAASNVLSASASKAANSDSAIAYLENGPFSPKPLFDSAHAVALKGVISEGQIVAAKGISNAAAEEQIQAQLYYTVGQFNGLNGVADLSRVKISVGERAPLDRNTETINYAAELFIAWPRDLKVPASYRLILPSHGDYSSLAKFFSTFGNDKKCLADEAHEVSQGVLWYYYRPEKKSCSLAKDSTRDEDLATTFNIDLSLSEQNTDSKAPEYEKIWEDGRLVVTAIFGMNEGDTPRDNDAGVEAFQELYNDLIEKYGNPTSSSLSRGQEPGLSNRSVDLSFKTEKGLVEAHLFVVKGIREVNQDFITRYNELTAVSDFVSYSGHSGLGANIQALANMGEFKKGQYQIYLVNGCDTFAYVDNALRDAHAKVNPGEGVDRYFDVITNAMPSFFSMNSRSNMSVIDALLNQKKTYREILAGFDQSQRAVVTGEEDNRWPEPFTDVR